MVEIEDPFGHQWSVATYVRDPDPEEMKAALKPALPGLPVQSC
jgi:hypothetical protein